MDLGLAGKTALITGAAGGIGTATAELFAREGANVALFDIDEDGTKGLADRIGLGGGRALGGRLDVRIPEEFEHAVALAEQEFGGLDIVVNVAGGGTRQTLKTLGIDDWHRILDLNLTGPFNSIKAAAPALRRRGGGAIVTVASLASLQMSMNNGVSYTSAKSGVLGLTRHASYELGPDNIRVNAVLPGPVLTPQMIAKLPPSVIEEVPRTLPLGRWVQPSEVATALLFFCSPLSSACTGTYVVVDSGLHVGAPRTRDEYERSRDNHVVEAGGGVPG